MKKSRKENKVKFKWLFSFQVSILMVIIFPVLTYADLDVFAAEKLASGNVKVALIYGIAIVIAGIAIGIGLYYGLRSRSDK